MSNQQLMLPGSGASATTFTLRDLLAVLFRHKRTAVICFVGIMLGTGLAVLMNPYRASTKFVLSNNRVDPIISAQSDVEKTLVLDVSEEQINSEIEILRSGDVARRVSSPPV